MELLATALLSVFGGGVFGTVISNLLNRRKVQADAAQVNAEAAAQIVELYKRTLGSLQTEMDSMRKRVAQMEATLAARDLEVATLKERVRQLEITLKEKDLELAEFRAQKGAA